LVKELTNRGYKVAAVKHIPKKDFTMDTAGKDTWRFAQAGAETVLAVSENEIAILKRKDTSKLTVGEIVQNCGNNLSLIILEGFRSLVGQDENIPKIVAVKSRKEIAFALAAYTPIIAFTGKQINEKFEKRVPYFRIEEDIAELADLVEKQIGKKRNIR